MKNLANCKPSEFLKQTNRVRKSAEKWLTETDIANIRKRVGNLIPITDDMDKDEKAKALLENAKTRREQTKKNLSSALDAIMEEHPEDTLELLALLCFVEPEEVDNYPISDYLKALTDMVNDEAVLGFFTSLQRWAQMII